MRPERPWLRLTPRARGGRWRYYVVAPLVLGVIGPFILIYKLLVGWWLDPLLDRRWEEKFREQVKIDLAFLFRDFDGRFVPNRRTVKNVVRVTVEAADLRVVISLHHGEYGIGVARRDKPETEEDLESVLEVIYKRGSPSSRPRPINLAEWGESFRERFHEVQLALSEGHYCGTATAIDENQQQGMERIARVFNKPDGFFEAELVNPNDLMKKAPK